MAESVVTVSWQDHTRELATEFKSFLDNNSFVDCTISAEGQSLKAHRLVLSACSAYFHAPKGLLELKNKLKDQIYLKLFCEETEDHPLVILLDESFQNLKAVIDFMYLGVTQVPEGNYSAFVTLAKSLEVKGLSRISKNPPRRTTENVQDQSVKNQVTDEVKGSNTTQKVSSENKNFQKIAHHLDDNTDPVNAHSPAAFKGNSALPELRPKSVMTSSQEQGRLQDPSVKNQVTGEVKCSNATQKVSSGNKNCQKIAHHLDGNTDPVNTHSPASFKGNSALPELRPKSVMTPSQEQGRLQAPSVKNQGTGEVQGINASQKDSSENNSQKIAHRLDGNTDLVEARSPVSIKRNSALRALRPKSVMTPSQGRSQGMLYLQVQPCLYTPISGTKNLLVKSNESFSRNFTSQMGGETASVQGQVFLISGAGSLAPVGLQATQQRSEVRLLSGGSQHSTTPLLYEVQDAMPPSPSSSPADRKRKRMKKYICKVCGRAYVSPAQLDIHNRTHTGERPFLCDVCGASFIRKSQLAIHSTIHTGERPYECEFCGKRFRQKSNLNLHLPLHTGKRPHRCDVCGKTFVQKQEFTEHKSLHTGDRPHSCDICGIAFRRADNLRIHKFRHTGEWPCRCDVCGMTFSRKSRLTQHKRSAHSSERLYKCDVCGKMLRTKWSLVVHGRVHTGERPYGCELCGARFSQQPTLAYHMRTHNKTQPP